MIVLILHGIGGFPGIHWQQWLHDELVKKKHTVWMPMLPKSDHPDRKEWLSEISRILKQVDLKNLIIVGHSLGVTTALDFIETLDTQIRGLISVSGFAKDYGSALNSSFLKQKEIDLQKVRKNIKQPVVVFGDDDPYVPQDVLEDLAKQLFIASLVIPEGGHLNTESGFKEFPLFLEIIEKL